MSEQCPNCGSAVDESSRHTTDACNLIRELKLADARKRADQPNIVGAAPRSRPLSPGQKLLVDDAVSTIKEALDDGCLVPEQPPNDEPAAGTSIKINLPQAAIPALEDLLRQERDAERDRAADWLERRATQVDGVRGYLCVENTDAADSLRANEHRTPQTLVTRPSIGASPMSEPILEWILYCPIHGRVTSIVTASEIPGCCHRHAQAGCRKELVAHPVRPGEPISEHRSEA